MRHKTTKAGMLYVSTPGEAIRALGGPTLVARWLKLSPSAVSTWITRDGVGRGYHLHVYLSLRRKGFRVAPQVFGIESWDEVLMPVPARKSSRARK